MCADPNRCIPSSSHIGEEKCVCASGYKIHDGNCVPNDQCGCYDTDKGDVLQVSIFSLLEIPSAFDLHYVLHGNFLHNIFNITKLIFHLNIFDEA